MRLLIVSSSLSEEALQGARELLLSCLPYVEAKVQSEDVGHAPDTQWDAKLIIDEGQDGSLEGIWQYPGRDDIRAVLPRAGVDAVLTQPVVGKEAEIKILVKHVVKHLVRRVFDIDLPWGTLTGVRPSKLLHRMDDLDLKQNVQKAVLMERYGVRRDKVDLLEEIGELQRPLLKQMQNNPGQVAVYIGIPFCPSRCSYCSFPGYVLDPGRGDVSVYLKALEQEIAAAGQMMKDLQLTVASLYLGGGTPTILTVSELNQLVFLLREHFVWEDTVEFTVEGGRPDTLSLSMLECLKEAGVNRISINPQTMNDGTLERIGRLHSAEQVIECYTQARSMHDWIINMDIILGLPGEGMKEVDATLDTLAPLKPDNLTVHLLALKRGSKEWENGYDHFAPSAVEKIQTNLEKTVRSWGMQPYYLYKQRRMAGNLENIGFALPGKVCRYNIGIMEERQHILGLGAGSASKIVNSRTWALENIQHSSYWKAYAENWQKVHGQREKSLNSLAESQGAI